MIQAACKKTSKRFTCHSLRHGFASWLVLMGEHMADVAAWCHHSTTATTERYYVHLRPRGRAQLDSNRERVATMWSQALENTLVAG